MLFKRKEKMREIPRLAGFLPGLRYRVLVALIALLLSYSNLSADSDINLRVYPGIYFPLNDPLLQNGFGAAAAVDFVPYPFFGAFVQGEYVGVGLENIQTLTLLDASLGAGFIWRASDRFSLRSDIMAGLYSVTRDKEGLSGISTGLRLAADYHITPAVSMSLHGSYRHYAYTPKPFMNSLNVGISLNINLRETFNPQTHAGAEAERRDPVFPVLYSWYDENDFALIKITNNEPNTITDIRVSFFLEQYMGQPKVFATIARLEPGESLSVPATAFFNETMLELTERVDAEARVIVEYRRLGARKRADIPVSIPVFHRNAMTWEDDRRAAAFVSARDPAALWFSKYVSSIVSDRVRRGVNRNIQYALGVFEALNVYGLNYVIDPTSAYADFADNSSAVDFLAYPYQTLMYRAGDCDDLSILYCSLLEAIGIETAFVLIPGHIYPAFYSGMTEKEAKESFHSPDLLIYHEGKAWVPVEITIVKEGFSKAWRLGAKQWNDSAARGTAELLPMAESWKVYKPVSIPGAASRFNLPEETRIAQAFDSSLNGYVEGVLRPQIRTHRDIIARSDTPENRNRLGVLYGRYGMLKEARDEFIRAARAGYIPAWINLGNLLFMEQKYTEALEYYSYVLSRDRNNTLALLGSARSYYELDEFRNSDALYAALVNQDPDMGREYAYLSSFFDTRGRAWSLSERLTTTPWALPEPGSTANQYVRVADLEFPGSQRETPAQTRQAASAPAAARPDTTLPLSTEPVPPAAAVAAAPSGAQTPTGPVVPPVSQEPPVVALAPAPVQTGADKEEDASPKPGEGEPPADPEERVKPADTGSAVIARAAEARDVPAAPAKTQNGTAGSQRTVSSEPPSAPKAAQAPASTGLSSMLSVMGSEPEEESRELPVFRGSGQPALDTPALPPDLPQDSAAPAAASSPASPTVAELLGETPPAEPAPETRTPEPAPAAQIAQARPAAQTAQPRTETTASPAVQPRPETPAPAEAAQTPPAAPAAQTPAETPEPAAPVRQALQPAEAPTAQPRPETPAETKAPAAEPVPAVSAETAPPAAGPVTAPETVSTAPSAAPETAPAKPAEAPSETKPAPAESPAVREEVQEEPDSEGPTVSAPAAPGAPEPAVKPGVDASMPAPADLSEQRTGKTGRRFGIAAAVTASLAALGIGISQRARIKKKKRESRKNI